MVSTGPFRLSARRGSAAHTKQDATTELWYRSRGKALFSSVGSRRCLAHPSTERSGSLRQYGLIVLVMPSIPTFRRAILQLLLVVVPLGVASKFYGGPAQHWVRNHAGGILYVGFWILLVLMIRPTLSPRLAAVTVLGITCLLEVLQLWHPPVLEAVRSTFIGHAFIGSTFSWWDFPNYVLGAVLGVLFARWARTRASTHQGLQSAT
jgi:hypothetical protein